MSLPTSYTMKTGTIPAYFDAIQGAEAPERFSIRFLQDLGFTSSNDRLIIGILKDLGFIDVDGVPQERYYEFLDKDNFQQVLADGIRDAFSDLFAVNKEAHKLDTDGAYNKLRTLYKGGKKDTVVKLIARTFVALCDVADFTKRRGAPSPKTPEKAKEQATEDKSELKKHGLISEDEKRLLGLRSLQYHINIVLPETRDQAVYDAIFKSLRDHLG
jgi:hypothetical protein